MPIIPGATQSDTKLHVNINGELTLRSQKDFLAINNFNRWLQAWNKYERVLMTHSYTLYHGLATYRERIQQCSKKFYWSAVYAYDQRFRAQLAASRSLDFSSVLHDLYTTIFDPSAVRHDLARCHRCKSIDHTVRQCPFPKAQSPMQNQAPPSSHMAIRKASVGCTGYSRGFATHSSSSDHTGHRQRAYSLQQLCSHHSASAGSSCDLRLRAHLRAPTSTSASSITTFSSTCTARNHTHPSSSTSATPEARGLPPGAGFSQ